MGTYIYGLKNKKMKAELNGEKVDVQFMSFLHRYFDETTLGYSKETVKWIKGVARRNRRLQENARKRFEKYDGSYIIVSDKKRQQLIDYLQGDEQVDGQIAVYKELENPVWYDSEGYPAERIGILQWTGEKFIITEYDNSYLIDLVPTQTGTVKVYKCYRDGRRECSGLIYQGDACMVYRDDLYGSYSLYEGISCAETSQKIKDFIEDSFYCSKTAIGE